jgi:hypothetical protein
MLAHLRTEAYPVYENHIYPPELNYSAGDGISGISYEQNNDLIDDAKRRFEMLINRKE